MIQIKRNNKVFFTLEDFGEGSKLSYQLMDHHYIILKFSTATPVYFEIGDSVEIPDFGYFELTSAYFPKHNESDGYDYEMQMDAYYMSWKNKLCKYRPQHGANETSFKLTTTVGVHMNVILGNLKALGLTYNGKDFSVDYTTYNKAFNVQKRFLIEYGSISILDALNAICSEDALNCEWWIDGSIIYLGYCEMEGQTTFEQGVNVLSMSYSESKSTYITRLYAFGSDRNIPKGYFTGADADVTTDGVATDYLMLPNKEVDSDGFYAKDGYLENVNVVKNDKQAIEGVVMFEDEYPKVESAVSSIKTYDSTVDNEDGTKTTQTFWQVTATDSFATSFESSWKKSNLTLGIKFTSGALMGMEFDVNFKVIDKVNYFEIVANDTYGRTLPDGVMCPKVGNNFFLFNWDATKITDTDLIPAAQLSLFDRAKQYYQKTMISNSNFTCTMDGDKFYNGGTYDYHPLGEQVKLIHEIFPQMDSDGNHYRNSRIIGMDIKLDIPYDKPEYVVGEKAATSRLGKLEEKVDSITVNGLKIDGSAGVGGSVYVIGVNDITPETDSNVYSARRTKKNLADIDKKFLRKDQKDVAQFLITFLKGIKTAGIENDGDNITSGLTYSKNFQDSMTAGSGWQIDENGNAQVESMEVRSYIRVLDDVTVDRVHDANSTPDNRDIIGAQGFDLYMGEDGKSHLYIDYLVTRVKAFFAQLEIRRISYSGGTTIFSNAGSTIAKVTEIKSGDNVLAYKCYVVADDGTTKTMNWWHEGMMALCQTFNVADANLNVSNRYYWRLVVRAGQERLDGKLYNYVVLSNVQKFKGNEYAHGFIKPLATQLHYEKVYTDDNGQDLEDRYFFGYAEGVNNAPAEGDVIVQVGDQIRWKSRGNVIKLSTSTEDNATDNAPAITMYHNVGAPYKTGDKVNPYQWKEETCLISPESVRINAKNFHLFADNPDNVIEPYVVMYELVPTSSTLVKHDDGTTTPISFGGELYKYTGGNKTIVESTEYVIEAEVVRSDGTEEVLEGFASLTESVLQSVKSLKFVAYTADKTTKLASCDIAVLKDGAESEPGAAGESAIDVTWNPNPLVLSTKRDSNGNVSVVLDETSVAWVKFSRDGKYWGQNDVVNFYSVQQKGCNADVGRNENGFYVRIKSVTQQSVTTSGGKVIMVPVTTASVTVAAKYQTKDGSYSNIYTTLEVNIDVSAVWGGIEMNMQGLTSSFTEISNKYKDLPLKTQKELTEFSTKFEQTARKFSLKVSETALGRKNLLVGSAMRRQGEGVRTFIRYNSGIEMLNGVNGVNSFCFECVNVGEYPWMSWCGDVSENIKVEKGKTYTLSVWAKRDSDEMYCYYELWYRPSLTAKHDEGSRPLFLSGAFVFAKKNTWELKTTTFTVPADAQTEYLEVMLVCTPEPSKTTTDTIRCWYCQPMLVEGDEYVGWSMSEKDADYVGGNLLDNTDTLKVGGNLTLFAPSHSALHPQNDSAYEMNRQSYNGLPTLNTDIRNATDVNSIDMLEWTLSEDVIKKGQDYVFSFMAKGNKGGNFTAYFYHSNTSEKVFVEVLDRVESPNQYQAIDGNAQVEFKEDYVWKRYWVHWRVVSDKLPISMLIRCNKKTDMYVSQPKLEYGAALTEYTTYRSMYSRLLDAGIDITSRQITLTADNTMVRTQSGKPVAMFDENGINAELIKVDKAIANVIKTGELEAQNLKVTGNSTFGIWKIEHDNKLGDIITSKDTPVGDVEMSGSMIKYTPAFVRSGNPVGSYMRTGAFVTEFGQGSVTGEYTGIWLGRSAHTVASGSANNWNLPNCYKIQNSNVNVTNLTAYVYSPLGGETPSVYLYKPNGGVVMETNAVIRGGFANHVLSTSSTVSMDDSTGLVIANNYNTEITVWLPENPIAGQQVTVIQKSTGKVLIKSKKSIIRTVGNAYLTSQRKSDSIGQISLFIYDGTNWNCSYMNGQMKES